MVLILSATRQFFGAYITVLLFQIVLIVWAVTMMYPILKSLRHPIRSFWEDPGKAAEIEFDKVHSLAEWPEPVLKFAAIHFRNRAAHLRERVSVLLGAIDKVGILPLLGSTAYAVWKLFNDSSAPKLITPFILYITALCLGILYFEGLIVVSLSQRLEHFSDC